MLKALVDTVDITSPSCFIVTHREIEEPSDPMTVEEGMENMNTWLDSMKALADEVAIAVDSPKETLKEYAKKIWHSPKLINHFQDTLYLYLIDEVTGKPVKGKNYPIKIMKPLDFLKKFGSLVKVSEPECASYHSLRYLSVSYQLCMSS